MSFEDFDQFQEELEKAQKEQEEHSKLNKKEGETDDWGFGEVLKERQKHKDALRKRLLIQKFSDKEIDKLFKIISKAEEEMEIIKSKFDYKAKVVGSALRLQKDLIEVQRKMKEDFDKEFKRIIEKRKKQK